MRKRSEILESKTDEALGIMSKNIELGISKLLKSFGLSRSGEAFGEISKELKDDLVDLLKKHNIQVN